MNNGVTRRLGRVVRGGRVDDLTRRVAALEEAVDENRKLNQRLADVVDVVTEVLVPAVDRDDERLKQALDRLTWALDEAPPQP
jgi:hypothetical protein